ncbi:hypothetical protein [Flavobacterium sp.]|uniref:hypothetical protein n=1 Tax=Flavobacterium sp. TaxID=239 RepID=UPI00374CB9F8
MKKITIIFASILYFAIIILLRKYSGNHIISFLLGISNALGVTFLIYLITNKTYLKRE